LLYRRGSAPRFARGNGAFSAFSFGIAGFIRRVSAAFDRRNQSAFRNNERCQCKKSDGMEKVILAKIIVIMAILSGFATTAAWAQTEGPAPSAAADSGSGAAAASSGGGGASAGLGGPMGQILMFGGIFVVFYFLVLRPQSKRAKSHKSFLDDLKVGTRVVTNSGFFGKINAIDGNEVKLEIADRVIIRVLKGQIAGLETNAAEAVASVNQK